MQKVALFSLLIWLVGCPVFGATGHPLSDKIPSRQRSAVAGSEFVTHISRMDEKEREHAILEQLQEGNLPEFLRSLKPVCLKCQSSEGTSITATIFVMPDYLAIGSDEDFLRIPMNLRTAIAVASQFGFFLPTPKMVDAIYEQSAYHLTPQPMVPGPQMRSTMYYCAHDQKIKEQCFIKNVPIGELVSGHKKDVVLTNRLLQKPDKIAIYGWHQSARAPIQPLSTLHGSGYADYSHGIRLVSDCVLIDGKFYSIHEVLEDPTLAGVLSVEGPISGLREIIGASAHRDPQEGFAYLRGR